MIKLIIFDIHKVVARIDVKGAYSAFASRVGLDGEAVYLFHKENYSALLLGELTFVDFLKAINAPPGFSTAELLTIWSEELEKRYVVNQELISLIEAMRKRYTVVALTNVSAGRFVVDKKVNLYSHFDRAFLSLQEHLIKPDPAFYRLVLERMGVAPAEALLVDDSEQNILAARELGLHGIVFQSNEQLRTVLPSFGVKF